jgi:hypothetical protein
MTATITAPSTVFTGLADYVIALTYVANLDNQGEDCPVDEIGCDGKVNAQFYFLRDGEREMRDCCTSCLVQAIAYDADLHTSVVVEVVR